MQQIGLKTRRGSGRLLPVLVLPAILGACDSPPQDAPDAQTPEVAGEPSCGKDGRLSTQLYGSIARKIRWSSDDLQCESMLRPYGEGVRLRFTGDTAGSQIAILLALPELERGEIARETPTIVTLGVEGSGRFFSTPNLQSCWSDIATQDLIEENGNRYDVSGTLYCVAPLGEINGDAAISIPELAFRGVLEWSLK